MKFFEYLSKNIAAKVATIVVAAVVVIGGFLFLKMNPFGWNINFLGISELKIDDTANVVEKIKKISEFTTACYYEEFVLKEEKKEASKLEGVAKFVKVQADSTLNEIVILSKGTVRAGYDLSKISATDLLISNDTISISLPEPEVFDVILNPSDYEFFIREGKWSHEEITAIQSTAKDRVLNDALGAGILEKADVVGKERIQGLFKTFGFNVVQILN